MGKFWVKISLSVLKITKSSWEITLKCPTRGKGAEEKEEEKNQLLSIMIVVSRLSLDIYRNELSRVNEWERKRIYLRILRDTVRPIKHFFLSLRQFYNAEVLELEEKTLAGRLVVRGGDRANFTFKKVH